MWPEITNWLNKTAANCTMINCYSIKLRNAKVFSCRSVLSINHLSDGLLPHPCIKPAQFFQDSLASCYKNLREAETGTRWLKENGSLGNAGSHLLKNAYGVL